MTTRVSPSEAVRAEIDELIARAERGVIQGQATPGGVTRGILETQR